MTSTGNPTTKKKKQTISRRQLAGFLSTGAQISNASSQQTRKTSSQNLKHHETSIRRSLFSEKDTLLRAVSQGCERGIADTRCNSVQGGHQSILPEIDDDNLQINDHMGADVAHDTPPSTTEGGTSNDIEVVPTGSNSISRGSESTVERKIKGRGFNKKKLLANPSYVEVNEDGQPIGDSQRKMSTLIGCLARDPRRLPLDCFDWRRMDKEVLEIMWKEVKRSYTFPEGNEPYGWVMKKLHASWRDYKSELKEKYFNGKTHGEAIDNRPDQIPLDMWVNLIGFWSSEKGKKRSQIGSENRGKLQICHHSGTKTHARVRAEEEAKGNKMDRIQTWLKTHEPKEGSKLDDASAVAKDLIDKELAIMDNPEVGSSARDEVYKKVVGEDKYGYAKTFGLGVAVPRSRSKRCALEEEKAKRLRVEEEHKETKVKLSKTEERVDKLEKMMALICKQQGLSVDFSNIFDVEMDECDEDEDYEDVADDIEGNGVVGGEDGC